MAASLGVGTVVVAGFPIVLTKLGFTAAGIASGSIASWIQGLLGVVRAGNNN